MISELVLVQLSSIDFGLGPVEGWLILGGSEAGSGRSPIGELSAGSGVVDVLLQGARGCGALLSGHFVRMGDYTLEQESVELGVADEEEERVGGCEFVLYGSAEQDCLDSCQMNRKFAGE